MDSSISNGLKVVLSRPCREAALRRLRCKASAISASGMMAPAPPPRISPRKLVIFGGISPWKKMGFHKEWGRSWFLDRWNYVDYVELCGTICGTVCGTIESGEHIGFHSEKSWYNVDTMGMLFGKRWSATSGKLT